MNHFLELPHEIQYLIWKKIYKYTLDIINQKDLHDSEAQELVKYMFWTENVSKSLRKESIISFGHPLFVIHLKPLFHTKFKSKILF